MNRIKIGAWDTTSGTIPIPRRTRLATAWLLLVASRALDQLAQYIATPRVRPESDVDKKIEFHAESGAPEGALYVDGKLVGWLDGIRRL